MSKLSYVEFNLLIILLFLTILGCVAYLIAFKGVNNITDFVNELTTIVFPEV